VRKNNVEIGAIVGASKEIDRLVKGFFGKNQQHLSGVSVDATPNGERSITVMFYSNKVIQDDQKELIRQFVANGFHADAKTIVSRHLHVPMNLLDIAFCGGHIRGSYCCTIGVREDLARGEKRLLRIKKCSEPRPEGIERRKKPRHN